MLLSVLVIHCCKPCDSGMLSETGLLLMLRDSIAGDF